MSAHPHPFFSWNRVAAVMLRHIYLLRRSPVRLLELWYWPFLNMLMWGFISVYLRTSSFGIVQAVGLFLGAVVLWEVLVRSNLGMTITFVEELYSRNLGHLFISPLRPHEFLVAHVGMSLLRTMIGVVPAALSMAPLFGYSVFGLGVPLAAFFLLLAMFGWAFGMAIMSILIRWGLAAEGFAWASMFVFLPIAGVYYPISSLPEWLQPVSWALPMAYIFEGMRAIILDGVVRMDYLVKALALNILYMSLCMALFLWMFRVARSKGLLLNTSQ
jgi:ABC-2 type transport system permease protein